MLVHAVHALAHARAVELVVVAAPPDGRSGVASLLAAYDVPADVLVVAGGSTRQESVGAALAALPSDIGLVLVHDAARPLAPSELADAVVGALRRGAEAVVPGLPVADTVKRVDASGVVVATVPRDELRAIQTPQGFRRDTLAAAHDGAAHDGALGAATDDAGLVERLGRPVTVIPGHPEAFKVTRPLDLVLAEALLARRRAGIGVR
jgi:2-C-methyl-D-erythritol 4-phosphate cytidylyltransferase